MRIEVEQQGGRRLVIRARGNEIVIDDTAEDGGPGDGFRPTELLLGALAACMMGTLISFADGQHITVKDLRAIVEDETADRPKRLDSIDVRMTLETDASPARIATLERVAAACKIHNTLETSPDITLEFSASDVAG